MGNRFIIKLRVIYHVGITIFIGKGRVMTLCQFTNLHVLPLVTTHQLITIVSGKILTIVHLIGWENCLFSICIHIRAVDILRTENTHFITTVRGIETIGHKEEPVVSYLLYVSTLTGYIRTTGNLCSKISVRGYCSCCLTRFFIRIGNVIIT